jgi:hypothetical protein
MLLLLPQGLAYVESTGHFLAMEEVADHEVHGLVPFTHVSFPCCLIPPLDHIIWLEAQAGEGHPVAQLDGYHISSAFQSICLAAKSAKELDLLSLR